MRQLYEIDVPSAEALPRNVPPTHPLLWRYRVPVTIEHLKHTFQEEVASDDPTKCRLLAGFLLQVREEMELSCLVLCSFVPRVVSARVFDPKY